MALLYRSATADQMWAILEAHVPFTDIIKQSRRVKSAEVGWLKRMTFISEQDFPHVVLGVGDNFTGSGFSQVQSFAAETTSFGTASSDWVETRTSDFKLRIIYRDEKQGTDAFRDDLEMKCIEAFEESGRSLGLSYIARWGPWRGATQPAMVNSKQRPVTQIVIPVTYEFAGSALLPA